MAVERISSTSRADVRQAAESALHPLKINILCFHSISRGVGRPPPAGLALGLSPRCFNSDNILYSNPQLLFPEILREKHLQSAECTRKDGLPERFTVAGRGAGKRAIECPRRDFIMTSCQHKLPMIIGRRAGEGRGARKGRHHLP